MQAVRPGVKGRHVACSEGRQAASPTYKEARH